MEEESLIPTTILRNLNDKLYEKRKIGAIALEELVKQHRLFMKLGVVKKLTQFIVDVLVYSTNVNTRKGGLIGLAAVAIGMGKVKQLISISF
jgi:vacuole morphology and inheritance protein 14